MRILKGVERTIRATKDEMIVMEAKSAEGKWDGVDKVADQERVGNADSPDGIRCVKAEDALVRINPEDRFQWGMQFH